MNAMVRSATLCALMAGVALPAAAAKQVYRWVDDNGVVNYTTEPPPVARKAKVLASADAKVSSYDPVIAGLDATSQLARTRDYLRERNGQLQRELDNLRHARYSERKAAEDARHRRLEECQRQRHVDCETSNYYDDHAYPRTVVGARPFLVGVVAVPARVSVPRTPRARGARLSVLR